VRLETTDPRASVNAPLVLRFRARGLTSFAGLELVRRHWAQLGLDARGARRGYNPHHRKVPSYYPITAHEAQTGQSRRAQAVDARRFDRRLLREAALAGDLEAHDSHESRDARLPEAVARGEKPCIILGALAGG